MAEVISIAASIIAVIQITDRIATLCKHYIETARDAPSDLRVILLETTAVKNTFENLEFLSTCDTVSEALKGLGNPEGPIEGCRKSVVALEALFPAHTPQNNDQRSEKRTKLEATLMALAWPLKEKRARKLLEEIGRYKSTISLALTTESTRDIKEIKDKIVKEIDESQRQRMYKWFQHTDSSPLHNKACIQYEPGTGDWMLRNPDWQDWLGEKRRCLWVHGIPGAGKTVLMSHLFETARRKLRQKNVALAYYYCYFGRQQDEAGPFLRSLLVELCRQAEAVTSNMYNMFKIGHEPKLIELLNALQEILNHFDIAYVFVDALDESTPRENLLMVLRDLLTDGRFAKIHVCASSREYIDIESTMNVISISVSMANPFVEEDIRRCVETLVHSNHRFDKWPRDLLIEVIDAVATGAQGMFRWAICQIDGLKRLKCNRDIVKKALKNLPKTLYETYNKFLLTIDEDERLFAYHALHWISYHADIFRGLRRFPNIPSQVLPIAAAKSACRVNSSYDDPGYDFQSLQEMLGCLISKDVSEGVSFAHYTVREYLESPSFTRDKLELSSATQCPLRETFLRVLLTEIVEMDLEDFLLHENREDDSLKKVQEDFGWYCGVACHISLCEWKDEKPQDSTFELAFDLFDPHKDAYEIFMSICSDCNDIDPLHYPPGCENCLSTAEVETKDSDLHHLYNIISHEDIGIGISLIDKFLQSRPTLSAFPNTITIQKEIWDDYSDRFYKYRISGTIVEVVPPLLIEAYCHEAYLSILKKFEGEVDITTFIAYHNVFHRIPFGNCSEVCPLKIMLDRGADPNGARYRISPLQIAAHCWDYEGVKMLLERGADPNGLGHCEGILWERDTILSPFNNICGVSSLQACRYIACYFEQGRCAGDKEEKDKIAVEAILVQHGAREFIDVSRIAGFEELDDE